MPTSFECAYAKFSIKPVLIDNCTWRECVGLNENYDVLISKFNFRYYGRTSILNRSPHFFPFILKQLFPCQVEVSSCVALPLCVCHVTAWPCVKREGKHERRRASDDILVPCMFRYDKSWEIKGRFRNRQISSPGSSDFRYPKVWSVRQNRTWFELTFCSYVQYIFLSSSKNKIERLLARTSHILASTENKRKYSSRASEHSCWRQNTCVPR